MIVRGLLPISLVFAFAAACTTNGEVLTAIDGGSSSIPSPSPIEGGAPDSPQTEVPAGTSLTVTDVKSIVVAASWCGSAPNECHGIVSYAVDFATRTLTTTTCVENADGGAVSRPSAERTLTAEAVSHVRDALAGVRTAQAKITSFDGSMFGLSVINDNDVETRYSPEATCGSDPYNQIVQGWDALWSVVSTL